MNNYKTSKDYSQLKALLDAGHEVIIIHPIYGVGKAYKYESSDHKIVKYDFASFTIFSSRLPRLQEILTEQNIEYIEPTLPAAVPAVRPAYTNLVVELKQYLATTPPEQQQRDWEQIKAEFPDAGQVPVIFYGLSGSTSPATPTDNEPQSNQSDLDYLKSEIEKMHSFFLSESAEFPQCGAYQKAEAIADVLALFDSLPQKQLTHSVTKKTDQVPKFKIGDRIRLKQSKDTDTGVLITDISGRGRYLSEKGIICDIKEQDMWQLVPNYESGSLEQEYLRWFTNHFNGKRDISMSGEYLERGTQLELARYFAEYGKKEFIKAMKENHVDTI